MPAFKQGDLARITGREHKGKMYHFFRVGLVVRVMHETLSGNFLCTDGECTQSIRPEDLEKIEP